LNNRGIIKIDEMLNLLDEIGYVYEFFGDRNAAVIGASPLRNYIQGTITWLKKRQSSVSLLGDIFILVTSERDKALAQNLIVTDQPKNVFFQIVNHFFADTPPPVQIGGCSFISKSVRMGEGVSIGCNCTIDGDIYIGDGVIIGNNVSIINRVTIGNDTVIHSGCVIGHDGFGWFDEGERHEMIRHIGGVNIGSDVLVGANTIVSRGALDDTVIGDGCKIDGHTYIAHNVVLGCNVIVVGHTSFGGSVEVGQGAYISTSNIINQMKIGEGAFVGYGSVVIRNVKAGDRVVGNPARSIKGF
jgi:UDP-3-O-[3-hydroxymyristoyl] glucosamine N-acyltransferase